MKILRDGLEIYEVSIDDKTILTKQIMGDNEVNATWISREPINISLGDYILVGQEKYYLNNPAGVEKKNNFTYIYTAVFESELYRLFNKIFMDEGSAEFTYFGTPEEYLLLLIENINSIDSDWTLDYNNLIPFQPKFITFNSESCRQALTRICEEFELEFRLVGREIIVSPEVGFDTLYSFEYGRGKGLYSLVRSSDIENGGVVTRLYAFGGEKNLSFDYRNGARRLVFDVLGNKYIEANVELYGIKEGTVTFDDIFPQRTGSVVSSSGNNRFIDTSIDFNVNDFLLEGVTPKVVFKSGALSGYTFEVRSFNNATKEVIFNDLLEANDYVLPNDLNKPEIGDTYTFVDIKMPQTYIDDAEAALLSAAQDYLDKKKSPTVTYTLDIDEKFIRVNGVELDTGQRVRIVDQSLGLDEMIRIYSISYPLVNPSKISAEITDKVPYTIGERLLKDNSNVKGEIITIDRTRAENYRDALRRVRQLQGLVFDPDGYFDMTNIRPGSIETLQLAVGANSQNFGLIGVEIEPNYEGNPNSIRLSAGQLVHFEIEIEELGYIWEIDQLIDNALVSAQSYYVYLRCNKNALQGAWKISTEPITAEQEPGWYHFWAGILYPVENDRRYFMFTKGLTYIVGDTITTGRIKSLDELNFFDLSNGSFNLGNEDQGIDWNVTNEGKLTIRGAVIANAVFAEDGIIQNLRVNSLRTGENGKRIEILADNGADPPLPLHNLKFYDSDGNLAVTLDTAVDQGVVSAPKAGLKIEDQVSNTIQLVTQNGVLGEGSSMTSNVMPSNHALGSVVGVLKEKFFSLFKFRAGVVGYDATPQNGQISFGGWFNSLLAQSIHTDTVQIQSNYTISEENTFISCYNNSNITVFLPPSPKVGRIIEIRRNLQAAVIINGNGRTIIDDGGAQNTISPPSRGDTARLRWDGTHWLYNGWR
ncbi:hypothetical protein MM236_19210 [Belliella sp. DSM 107340]|uniref:Uncharacterized protein n=1 Tax=Belliella calami TaxID=2923436 RepID=A0ABS9UV48_9BACT|nr:hypothetical protein [Belliella calami]MCH7400133.1 hypothetical protein [Belliella calami]